MITLALLVAPIAIVSRQDAAKDVVDQMFAAYAAIDTYRDSGTLEMSILSNGSRQKVSTKKFKTAFVRPLLLKVQIDGTGVDGKPTVFAFARQGAKYKVFLSEFGRSHFFPTYESAMPEAAALSNGVARTVPQILMIADVGKDGRDRWNDLSLAATEQFHGVQCDVLTSKRGDIAYFTYWIDHSTHMVVGMRKILGTTNRAIETLALYKPEPKAKVPPNEATFIAPNGGDFVGQPKKAPSRHGNGGGSTGGG